MANHRLSDLPSHTHSGTINTTEEMMGSGVVIPVSMCYGGTATVNRYYVIGERGAETIAFQPTPKTTECKYCHSTDGQRSKYRPDTCLHCGGKME